MERKIIMQKVARCSLVEVCTCFDETLPLLTLPKNTPMKNSVRQLRETEPTGQNMPLRNVCILYRAYEVLHPEDVFQKSILCFNAPNLTINFFARFFRVLVNWKKIVLMH
jgi:hypothetical protein